jgi:ankyrin repeat protein
MVEKLLNCGNKINAINQKGENYLMLVCEASQKLEIIKLLFDKMIDIYQKDPYGKNALMYLSKNPSISKDTLQFFSNNGYNFQIVDEYEENAFLCYIKNANIQKELIKIFLDRNCDINSKNKYNSNCISLLTSFNTWNLDILDFLINLKANVNPLNDYKPPLFNCEKDIDKIKLLVDRKCDLNIQDKEGNSFLHK